MTEPATPVFRMELGVTPDLIDELGHVANLVYVQWVLQVAGAHSEAAGYDLAAYQALGAVFVVRRQEVEYLRPALRGDRLELATWVESWKAASSVRRTSITRVTDGVELARATTLWAFIDWETGRPTRIPEEVRRRFTEP